MYSVWDRFGNFIKPAQVSPPARRRARGEALPGPRKRSVKQGFVRYITDERKGTRYSYIIKYAI